jgi:DivIVA domain-containing protein
VDREDIERHDFPSGRRGYDPEAVDAHLRRVAGEFEALRDRAQRPASPAPLSAGASDQVRLILEAAERSAAELRANAGEEAAGHVARVGEAVQDMLARVSELERALDGLLEAVRRGGARLTSALAQLQEKVEREAGVDRLLAPSGDGDDAGARLIALNMALGGSPRDETARYLAEHFALADPATVLDDVYARAGR